MEASKLRPDEAVGLGIAALLHAALLAALLLQPAPAPPPPLPERVTVSLAEEVGLEAAAPEPVPESSAAIAPVLAPLPAPPPEPVVTPPRPAPRPVATTAPRPRATPTRAAPRQPQARSPETPSRQAANTDPRRRPDRAESRPAPQRPTGGNRIGADFLPGAGSSATSNETRIPASQIGASAKASLLQSLARQLKPHWSAPDGADADRLFTLVSWQLNEDGSLRGTPSCKPTQGVTESNRPQAERHCDYAIRAVRRAAPFNLPDEYYNAWKSVRDFKFSGTL